MRSATEKSGVLASFSRIATTTRSAKRRARSRMSPWPLVNGSKEPGYRATRSVMFSPCSGGARVVQIPRLQDLRPREPRVARPGRQADGKDDGSGRGGKKGRQREKQ